MYVSKQLAYRNRQMENKTTRLQLTSSSVSSSNLATEDAIFRTADTYTQENMIFFIAMLKNGNISRRLWGSLPTSSQISPPTKRRYVFWMCFSFLFIYQEKHTRVLKKSQFCHTWNKILKSNFWTHTKPRHGQHHNVGKKWQLGYRN